MEDGVDEGMDIYRIYSINVDGGGVSTDNPRPYNPESNAPVMQF